MIQDKLFTFITTEKVSNGMGGFTTKEVEGDSFTCYIAPQNATVMLKEYGIVTTEGHKLITSEKVTLPLQSLILKHDKQIYKILQHLPLKYNIFLVEKVK